jgi:hypothetical protein
VLDSGDRPGNRCAPTACVTSTSLPSAARTPSSGVTAYCAVTPAVPPPWITGSAAFGPSTATRRSEPSWRGSVSRSFRTSTIVAAAASLSSTPTRSGPEGRGAGTLPGTAPTRAASRTNRRALSATSAAATRPSRTAKSKDSSHGPAGPGMTRPNPASADAATDRVAYQSDTTTPSKPHSVISGSVSSRLSVMVIPLTRLYAAITSHTPPSTTNRSNGARYTSRRVRSSTRTSTVNRPVSASFAT